MRTAFRRAVFAGILAGLAYAVWRVVQARVPKANGTVDWETAPFPFPPAPRPHLAAAEPDVAAAAVATETVTEARPEAETAVAEAGAAAPWVDAVSGACPASHPVKGKRSSGIFHVPGGQNYERTHADRCYVDAAAAEADGLRQSKR
jgi:hypothetical protein